MKMNRRQFIYGAAVAAAGWSARSWSQVAGANSDIRVGVVGFRGRGGDHINNFNRLKGCRLVALCDADTSVIDKEMNRLTNSSNIKTFTDVRKMLEDRDLDVVSIATPNHWHSLGALWAIQSGKDVYVEKPVSHNVFEGRKVVEAARKYKKIVQTGTQVRSNPGVREAIQFIHDGNLGKIKLVRGLCYKRRDSIGKVNGPQPIPENVDYDLWCGPAPMEPLMRKSLHYDWHWVWSTGNGDLGNQGIHQMDVARWALKQPALSPAVFSIGGRLGYVDDGQTPNTQVIYHDYPEAPLIFEVRGLPARKDEREMDAYRGSRVGNVVDCENGYVVFPSYDSAILYDLQGKEVRRWKEGANHYQNFLDAVRSRRHQDLNADILEGHLSSALCHTGNISHLVGARKSPDEIRERIKGNSEAMETFGRMVEHLKANEVDINSDKLVLGEYLRMNPKTEQFRGNREANALLTRNYRKPYVVPDRV
jgi:predicted dehydrogenase